MLVLLASNFFFCSMEFIFFLSSAQWTIMVVKIKSIFFFVWHTSLLMFESHLTFLVSLQWPLFTHMTYLPKRVHWLQNVIHDLLPLSIWLYFSPNWEHSASGLLTVESLILANPPLDLFLLWICFWLWTYTASFPDEQYAPML